MRRHSIILAWLLFVFATVSFGQEFLIPITASNLKSSSFRVIQDTSKVLLVVKTNIRNLKFETTHGQILLRKFSDSEWRLQLEPGTHRMTFSAYLCESLTKTFSIPKEDRSKEIDIRIADEHLSYYLKTLDPIPPEIIHAPIREVMKGDSIKWEAKVTDSSGVKEAKLFYRPKGEIEYRSEKMNNPTKDVYQWQILAEQDSVEYYLTASDSLENLGKWMSEFTPQLIVVKEKGGKKWLWIGLGATATVISVIAAIVNTDGNGSTEPTILSKLPDPPPAPR